jgi:putative membrane protein
MARAWLLTFHLVGVVLWMGGLLTFSRVLGYHAREAPSVRPRYSWLEGRLNYLVTIPGAAVTIGFGLALVSVYGRAWFAVATWLHYKLALVGAVLVLHAILTVDQRRIARRPPEAPMRRARYAALHGTLGLLLVAILALATHQPMAAGVEPADPHLHRR